jgi:hypothetical protein
LPEPMPRMLEDLAHQQWLHESASAAVTRKEKVPQKYQRHCTWHSLDCQDGGYENTQLKLLRGSNLITRQVRRGHWQALAHEADYANYSQSVTQCLQCKTLHINVPGRLETTRSPSFGKKWLSKYSQQWGVYYHDVKRRKSTFLCQPDAQDYQLMRTRLETQNQQEITLQKQLRWTKKQAS